MKKNKKGQLSLIVKMIFAGLIITLVVSTIFNPSFYYDALDFIENLFQPPEVDPLPSTTQTLIARERGLSYLEEWVDAFEKMKNAKEEYCYELIPATTRESRDHELAVRFSSNEKNNFRIGLTQEGAVVSAIVQINAPLCLIAQPRRADSEEAGDILKNFRAAFYSGNEQAKNFCLNNPERCAIIFSKPELLSDDYANYENFQVDFLINAPDRANRRNSFYLRYRLFDDSYSEIVQEGLVEETQPEQRQITVFDDSSGRLSEDAGFVLFKLGHNLCIMPLATAWRSCEPSLIRNSRNAGDIRLLRSNCFFDGDLPNEELEKIPTCTLRIPIMSEEEAKEKAKDYLINTPSYDYFKSKIKDESAQGIEDIFRLEFEIVFKDERWRLWANNSWYPIGESRIYEQIDYETQKHDELKPYRDYLINVLREFTTTEITREEGIEIAINLSYKEEFDEVETRFAPGTYERITEKFMYGDLS